MPVAQLFRWCGGEVQVAPTTGDKQLFVCAFGDGRKSDYPLMYLISASFLVREQASHPTDEEAEGQEYERHRVALFDAVNLRQNVGGGDGEERAGRDADRNGDIFRR